LRDTERSEKVRELESDGEHVDRTAQSDSSLVNATGRRVVTSQTSRSTLQ
jgi:hypothetical protein